MTLYKTTIERALELAATGQFKTMSQIRTVLRREGYVLIDSNLAGRGVRDQIRALIRGAKNDGVSENGKAR